MKKGGKSEDSKDFVRPSPASPVFATSWLRAAREPLAPPYQVVLLQQFACNSGPIGCIFEQAFTSLHWAIYSSSVIAFA